MNSLASANRDNLVHRTEVEHYELIVIGGGITGAGIALDASTRGLKTVLLEKGDFASGASSKSSKMIHGGLRQLKPLEFDRVREIGRERTIVHHLAPHLVINEKMMLPVIKGGAHGRLMTSLGLKAYDMLTRAKRMDRHEMVGKRKALGLEPLMSSALLKGAGMCTEYRTDDARLTLELLKTADQKDADVLNYAEVVDLMIDDGRVRGVLWRDCLSGEEHRLHARHVINAAGPWINQLRGLDPSPASQLLQLAKSVHIVVPRERLPIHHTIRFETSDSHMIFAIPRDRVVYIGTTDTQHQGDLADVRVELKDVEQLIRGLNQFFPEANLETSDVESSWAGLRPLIARDGMTPSKVTSDGEVLESKSGLLSVAGGELTTYRKLAERVVDRLDERIQARKGRKLRNCSTHKTLLTGGVFEDQADVERYTESIAHTLEELDSSLKDMASYLVHNYGHQSDVIVARYCTREGTPHERLALSELDFTLDHEAVFTLLDFFERRTGRLYFDIHSIAGVRDAITARMRERLHWSDEETRTQTSSLDEAIRLATEFR